jgi:low temperature requirement protein LtrA
MVQMAEMSAGLPPEETLHHHRRMMRGRDPYELHRVATPLELLFDLTFASSFGLAAAQFAHLLAEAHYAAALTGFGFSSFAICWAWINFSWFSSAYDTDDWSFRLATMIQMTGVIILAIGLPRMFASLEHGGHLDNTVMVLGYVVMRIPMVFQWLRAARQDPRHRRACLTYAIAISVAQVGWIVQILVDAPIAEALLFAAVLAIIEFSGPITAERKDGGTPWHAHHIAERYSLFAIIALGEGVVGTAAAVSATAEAQGWNTDTVLVCIAGVGLTFGMWWVYYLLPSSVILHAHRDRAFAWSYGQIVIIASIVATGAGLHATAYFIAHQSHTGALATLLSTAVPVAVFLGSVYALHAHLVRRFSALHGWLLAAIAAVLGGAILAVSIGVDVSVGLVLLMLAPAVTVVGYEAMGHRDQATAITKSHPQ